MNSEELEKSKNELLELKKKNDRQIGTCDERTRMSKVNSLEYKLLTTLFFSMLGFTALFLTTLFLKDYLGLSTITNIFPGYTYPFALLGTSLGIGSITKVLFDKKYKVKERLNDFSTAKKDADKLEDEIHYQIELEKAINRNKVIKETINVLESNGLILEKISSGYDFNNKNMSQTKDRVESQVTDLLSLINEKYEKLDILTTQKVLCERFWRIRDKFQRKADALLVSIVGGAATLFFTTFPALFIELNGSIIPFFIGIVGSGAYMIKKNKDYKKVFNKFNAALNEFALEENRNKKYDAPIEEQKEIEKSIESQIKDISLAEAKLQESKRCLESYTATEDDKKKDVLFKDYPNLKVTEETKKYVLEHPELYSGLGVRERMGKFYTDEEWDERREEVLNTPLPGGEKNTPKSLRKIFRPKKKDSK